MQPSMTMFYQDLWLEHLEEVAALYEQRAALVNDPELSWFDLEEYERRIEAHLDALYLGGDRALALCCEQAAGADAGTLYGAVCLLCRHDRFQTLAPLLGELTWDDEDIRHALRDALVNEAPQSWFSELVDLCTSAEPDQAAVLVSVLGRLGSSLPVVHRLRAEPSAVAIVAGALGKLEIMREKPWLREILATETDPGILEAACLALLTAGDETVPGILAGKAAAEAWARIPLALVASPASARQLTNICRGDPEARGTRALGLLGDVRAVDTLLARLEDEELAPHAALALQWLTGAGLFEEVFVAEPFDEDALFEEDIEALEQGGPVLNPNRQPAGEQVRRLARDPQTWRQWWRENRSGFSPDLRYRHGQPMSPAVLLGNLEAEDSDHGIRMLAARELVIRYGAEISLYPEMPIARQKKAIAAAGSWIAENGARFEAGKWYLHGKAI